MRLVIMVREGQDVSNPFHLTGPVKHLLVLWTEMDKGGKEDRLKRDYKINDRGRLH